MASCACGGPLTATDRFCARCGAASPTIDDVAAPVSSAAPTGWVLIGALAVAALAWGLLWGGGSSPAIDRTPATAGPVAESEGRAEPNAGLEPTGADRTAPSATAEQTRVEQSPILGERTGLGLAIGFQDAVRIIDLDSGARHELPQLSGTPVAALGTTLVIDADDGVVIAELTSADPEPFLVEATVDRRLQVVAVSENLFWVAAMPDPWTGTLSAYTSEGRKIDEMSLPDGGTRLADVPSAEVFYNPAGGIYRREDGAFRRLMTGQLLAAGDRLVLIRECDQEMACRTRWHDLTDWAPVELPVPGFIQNAHITIEGGDRWMVHTDRREGGTSLIEIATGLVVREWSTSSVAPAELSFSPDGRWMTDRIRSQNIIVDLDSGSQWEIEDTPRSSRPALFFDLDGTAFAEPGQ